MSVLISLIHFPQRVIRHPLFDLFLGDVEIARNLHARKGKEAVRHTESWPQGAFNRWRDGTWKRLHEWDLNANVLTPDERDLVGRASMASNFNFKGFRLKKLREAWKRAVDAGFV